MANINPDMTSNTAPAGTCSASTELNASYLAFNAFDYDTTTAGLCWATSAGAGGTGWLQYNGTVAYVCTQYDVQAEINPADPDRAPNDWTFLGSNDGTTWGTLDTQVDQVFSSGETKNYPLAGNTTAYLFHRINITANNGDTYLTLEELTLTGTIPVAGGGGYKTRATLMKVGG